MTYKFVSAISVVFLLTTTFFFAQKSDYSTLNISDSLKENANVIVRLNQMDIVIAIGKK
jgi:flagellar biosynthesis/type III secretory pathway M-ring protein FliF/YscJ